MDNLNEYKIKVNSETKGIVYLPDMNQQARNVFRQEIADGLGVPLHYVKLKRTTT